MKQNKTEKPEKKERPESSGAPRVRIVEHRVVGQNIYEKRIAGFHFEKPYVSE